MMGAKFLYNRARDAGANKVKDLKSHFCHALPISVAGKQIVPKASARNGIEDTGNAGTRQMTNTLESVKLTLRSSKSIPRNRQSVSIETNYICSVNVILFKGEIGVSNLHILSTCGCVIVVTTLKSELGSRSLCPHSPLQRGA